MSMLLFKLLSLILILLITLLSGLYPFVKRLRQSEGREFPIGESLAAGVFLGAGLIHMLGDAADQFNQLQCSYPWASLLTGGVFLLFLLLEHIGTEVYHRQGSGSVFAVIAVVMLSIHSFLAGAALGVSMTLSLSLLLLCAILAHKWAASFALAVQINKSPMRVRSGVMLFVIFSMMTPLGIVFGVMLSGCLAQHPFLEPVFSSIAAGTFLYLGTLHGLERAVMIKQCCRLRGFSYVILGFVIMALVAVWT